MTLVLTALALLQVAAVYCAWRAVTSARTPQGAVGLGRVPFFRPPLFRRDPLPLPSAITAIAATFVSRRSSERVIAAVH